MEINLETFILNDLTEDDLVLIGGRFNLASLKS